VIKRVHKSGRRNVANKNNQHYSLGHLGQIISHGTKEHGLETGFVNAKTVGARIIIHEEHGHELRLNTW